MRLATKAALLAGIFLASTVVTVSAALSSDLEKEFFSFFWGPPQPPAKAPPQPAAEAKPPPVEPAAKAPPRPLASGLGPPPARASCASLACPGVVLLGVGF